MNSKNTERRDWTLIIFIVPIGVLLIFIVGQIAIQLLAHWSLFANMRSRLNPDDNLKPISFFQPLQPQILTPLPWWDTFLTPDDVSFPPFITVNPGATFTPGPVSSPTSGGTTTSFPTNTTVPATPTPVYYPTTTPVTINSNTPPPADTATFTPPPPTFTSPPPTFTVTPVPPGETLIVPTPTFEGFPSTPPVGGEIPPPPETGDIPDNIIGDLGDGGYFIFPLAMPVTVADAPDGNYEIILYEYNNGGTIFLDFIVVGISQFADANPYYQVFNWYDGLRDTNTIADYAILPPDPFCIVDPECDNRGIPEANLHPYPGTGILIDAETAPSVPPPGDYYYIIVYSPPGGSGESAQIDAIEIIP